MCTGMDKEYVNRDIVRLTMPLRELLFSVYLGGMKVSHFNKIFGNGLVIEPNGRKRSKTRLLEICDVLVILELISPNIDAEEGLIVLEQSGLVRIQGERVLFNQTDDFAMTLGIAINMPSETLETIMRF